MPPSLALFLTIAFVLVLFRQDRLNEGKVSSALWLPVMWIGIAASRFVSQWINLFTPGSLAADGPDGSPIDALYFLALILAGLWVLGQRHTSIGAIVRNNRWLVVFFIYAFLGIIWSDFPFIAFKRWIKTLGHPVMALIILTDPNPIGALRIVMKRTAYLLIPFSVLLIKYFPQYGRSFDQWSGQPVNNGVGLTKNDLGYQCMIFGLFFLWNLLTAGRLGDHRERRWELSVSALFLGLIAWLLWQAHSATSLASFVLGSGIMFAIGAVNRRFVGAYIVAGLFLVIAANFAFDLYAFLLGLVGRDPTLTDRTKVWTDVLALQDSPILGLGFESFWLGARIEALWAKWWWHPNQAHNGYIETYLNLGGTGVFLLICVLISTFRKITKKALLDLDFYRFRLALLLAIIAFNFTEASFKAVHPVWTMFYIIAIDYPRSRVRQPRQSTRALNPSLSHRPSPNTVRRRP
jgi:exopolysaccharide production protein ExoQ